MYNKEAQKAYYWRNKEKRLANAKKWRESNSERYKAQRKDYYEENKDKFTGSYTKWRNKDLERARKYEREKRAKMRQNPKYRLSQNIGRHVSRLLSEGKQGRKWEDMLGYTAKALMSHLESLFIDGMTWDNYGEWHVDHKIPVSFFEYNTIDDVEYKMCWRLENLQPLWATDNLQKSDKLETRKIA